MFDYITAVLAGYLIGILLSERLNCSLIKSKERLIGAMEEYIEALENKVVAQERLIEVMKDALYGEENES